MPLSCVFNNMVGLFLQKHTIPRRTPLAGMVVQRPATGLPESGRIEKSVSQLKRKKSAGKRGFRAAFERFFDFVPERSPCVFSNMVASFRQKNEVSHAPPITAQIHRARELQGVRVEPCRCFPVFPDGAFDPPMARSAGATRARFQEVRNGDMARGFWRRAAVHGSLPGAGGIRGKPERGSPAVHCRLAR